MPVGCGIVIPQGFKHDLRSFTNPVDQYEAMTRVATEAENLGYDAIWLYDHLQSERRLEDETTFECWTSTAALARDTTTIRIGQMVNCNLYRSPALLAKMASTVDVLSHGRLDFGIGAGWYEQEARAYGYLFPNRLERVTQLEEAIQIILALWQESSVTFSGRHYQISEAINTPKGIQLPHIPLWVGGNGEETTLRLAAYYANACNIIAHDPVIVERKFAALRKHCAEAQRDYTTIRKSVHAFVVLLDDGEDLDTATKGRGRISLEAVRRSNIVGTPPEVAEQFHQLIEAGAEYFVVYFRNRLVELDTIRLFARDVMPLLRSYVPVKQSV